MSGRRLKVGLVGSSGGHLDHLYLLRSFWENEDRFWACFDKQDARSHLEGETFYPLYYPANRSLKALIINNHRAIKILRKEKPDMIISSGAAPAVPFYVLGKMMGIKLIFIETFDRFNKPSLTGKICYRFADVFIVQWEGMKKIYPKAIYIGSIF